MHAFVQDCHNPDIAVRQVTPIDKMALIAKKEALDTKFGRDGSRHHAMGSDLLKGGEQAGNVFLGLVITPSVTRVPIDVIKAMGCTFLDSNDGHALRTGSV